MKYRLLTSLSAILTTTNGLFFLFFPGFSLFLLEANMNLQGLYVTRLSGACAVSIGLMTWLSRNFSNKEHQLVIVSGNAFMFFTLTILDIYGYLSKIMNEVVLLIFVADLILFWIYFQLFIRLRHDPPPPID